MIDVTSLIVKSSSVSIPATDGARAAIFGDPVVGILKHVVITDDYGHAQILEHTDSLFCIANSDGKFDITTAKNPEQKLQDLHAKLKLSHGSFTDEYPEQVMAVTYIQPTDTVLEIGANIGRNSLIIASLLDDSRRLVSVESDPASIAVLEQNRDANGLQFCIIPAAISKRPLFQSGWRSIPADTAPPGTYKVNTITYDTLKKQTDLQFNTLVADCEGALYYILQEEPQFLSGIEKVIVENDYLSLEHKLYVDRCFHEAGLHIVYSRPLGYNAGMVCQDKFFEVWSV